MMMHDDMIAVIQAHKDGKTIECAALSGAGTDLWIEAKPRWQFDTMKYRVKPEPRTFYGIEFDHGNGLAVWNNAPQRDSHLPVPNGKAITLLEVL